MTVKDSKELEWLFTLLKYRCIIVFAECIILRMEGVLDG